jgi:DNA-binding transcriptional LysR family regulator
MLDVRRLQLLCDLSRLGTIAAVAAAHTYTASAVSQQLSALEREAGVRLLARTGRSVTLTAAGRILVRHGTAVLAELEQATASLAAVAGGVTGPLRIGAFPTAVRALFPATLVTLSRTHPGLELMVSELDPAGVPGALRDRRIDVGLINDYDLLPARPDPGLDDVPLLDEPVYLALPDSRAPDSRAPDSRAGDGTHVDAVNVDDGDSTVDRVNIDDSEAPRPGATRVDCRRALRGLRDAPWILATPGTVCHAVTVRLCRSAGFAPRARHHADDFTTVLALVAAGLGASVVPAMAVEGAAVEGAAVEGAMVGGGHATLGCGVPGVRLQALPTRRRTRIAYRKGAAGHPAVAAFVTAIRASRGNFAEGEEPDEREIGRRL